MLNLVITKVIVGTPAHDIRHTHARTYVRPVHVCTRMYAYVRVCTRMHNISHLTFMLPVADNTYMCGKPYIGAIYTDVQATCGLLLYNMGTGAVTRVSGYVV